MFLGRLPQLLQVLYIDVNVFILPGGRVLTKNSGSKHKKERKHPKKVGESERKGARVCESMFEKERVRVSVCTSHKNGSVTRYLE